MRTETLKYLESVRVLTLTKTRYNDKITKNNKGGEKKCHL